MTIDTQSTTTSLLPILLTPAVILVTGLLASLVNWAKDMGASARRLRRIDEAKKRLEFWSTWREFSIHSDPLHELQEQSDMEKTITLEVKFAADTVAATRREQLSVPFESASPARRFFLLYQMTVRAAKIHRIVSYSIVLYGILIWPIYYFLNSHASLSRRVFWGYAFTTLFGIVWANNVRRDANKYEKLYGFRLNEEGLPQRTVPSSGDSDLQAGEGSQKVHPR
jgi:hypothetical protein